MNDLESKVGGHHAGNVVDEVTSEAAVVDLLVAGIGAAASRIERVPYGTRACDRASLCACMFTPTGLGSGVQTRASTPP